MTAQFTVGGQTCDDLPRHPDNNILLSWDVVSVAGAISHIPLQFVCRSLAASIAANLKGTIASYQALSQLSSYKPKKVWQDLKSELSNTDLAQEVLQSLVEASSTDSGKRVVLTALTNHPNALTSLLTIIQVSIPRIFSSYP